MVIIKLGLCILLISICRNEASQNYYYAKGAVDTLSHCPGKYCGRMPLSNGSWSSCGACERGLRRNVSSGCDICLDNPTLYDWFYLGFMFLLPLVYHLISIDMSSRRGKFHKELIILSGIAFAEVLLSTGVTLLIFPPQGSFYLHSCLVRELADWYPLLHNPNPNYEGQLYCTQEAVYPLYSIVFVFYTLCLVAMLLVRSWLSSRMLKDPGKIAIYSALYFFPIAIVIHSVMAGLIYYSFPFIMILMSVISNAIYFACQPQQGISDMFWTVFKSGRMLVILFGHWFLHAYGVIAATEVKYLALLSFIPLPSLFYVVTSKFTDPTLFT